MNYKKFTRSINGRKIAGVCSGLGVYFNIDPTLVRIIFVCLSLFGGSGLFLYLIIWFMASET